MAARSYDDVFAEQCVLSLCCEGSHQADTLDVAMLDAEKAVRLSLWALTGLMKDYEGSVIDDEALEIVRQVLWQAEMKMREATGLYWKGREAEPVPTPEPAGNVVALAPRAGA